MINLETNLVSSNFAENCALEIRPLIFRPLRFGPSLYFIFLSREHDLYTINRCSIRDSTPVSHKYDNNFSIILSSKSTMF
jgi:hypothetical protein